MTLHWVVIEFSLKDIVNKTIVGYSQASSVHGIQYIFESGANLAVSKLIWVIFVIAAAGAGIYWSVEVSHIFSSAQLSRYRQSMIVTSLHLGCQKGLLTRSIENIQAAL